MRAVLWSSQKQLLFTAEWGFFWRFCAFQQRWVLESACSMCVWAPRDIFWWKITVTSWQHLSVPGQWRGLLLFLWLSCSHGDSAKLDLAHYPHFWERETCIYSLPCASRRKIYLKPSCLIRAWVKQLLSQIFVPTLLQANVSAHVFPVKHTTCSWHLCRVELSTPGLCHWAVWAEVGLCKDQKGQGRTPTRTPSMPHSSCGQELCLFAVKISVPAEVCFSTQSEIRWVVIAE